MSTDPPEAVDPVWLLKAIGLTLTAALICGYLTVCLLFYQGQWQLVLHPSRIAPAPSNIAGAPFQIIHFAVDEAASPQLTGWLIPAKAKALYENYMVLYLPSGDGSLADAVPTLSALHEVGVNVFAFDYRGYGQSAPAHPNQKRMAEDANSAWRYLAISRALPPSRTVLFGKGVGCALAVQLAAAHPEASAIILDSPQPEAINTVLADPRTYSLPVHVLFHETFEIVKPVSSLKIPKLFLVSSNSKDVRATADGIQRLTYNAATPKITSTLNSADFNGPVYKEQVERFFDQYLH